MKSYTLLLCLVFCGVLYSSGQAIENVNTESTAIAPSGAYQPFAVDTISADSGNVILSIPIRTFTQRGGHDVTVNLTYGAKPWAIDLNPDAPTWVFDNEIYDAFNGNTYGGVALRSNLAFTLVSQPVATGVLNPGVENNPAYTLQYGIESPDGGTHWMLPRSDGQWVSMDGGGFISNAKFGTDMGVISRDGIYHNDPHNILAGFPPLLWQDSNGNQITVTNIGNPNTEGYSDNVTVEDTDGRLLQLPLVYPFAGNTTTDFSSCTGTLPIVEARIVTWPSNGGNASYKLCYATIALQTNFKTTSQLGPISEGSGSVRMLQSVVLPDHSAWTFEYQDRDPSDSSSINYGDLTKVTFPTGGTITYTWSNTPMLCVLGVLQGPQSRTLVQRVEDDQDGNGPKTWTYTYSVTANNSNGYTLTTTITGPKPAQNMEIDTFEEVGFGVNTTTCSYQMSKIQEVDGPTGKTIKTTSRQSSDYRQTGNIFDDDVSNIFDEATYLPIGTTTTLDNGQTTRDETDYDQGITVYLYGAGDNSGLIFASYTVPYGSTIATRKYDFGSPSQGSLLSQTINTYYWQGNDTYAQAGLFDVPQSTITKDGSGNRFSESDYIYDTSTQGTSGLPQHVAPFHQVRGNLSSVAQLIASSGTSFNTSIVYDDAGMLKSTSDPNGTTSYGYDATDTFIASTTLPKPSSGIALTTGAQVDVASGLQNNTTDLNGVQSVYSGYDGLGRVGQVVATDRNGSTASKQVFAYTPTQFSSFDYQNASVYADTEMLFDGGRRLSRVAIANGQTSNPWYQQDLCYDTNGNVSFRSYRYQGNLSSSTKVCSGAGDGYSYDALGRVTSVTHGDGSSIQYFYQGRATRITDENGSIRIAQVDGLGRTTVVCEVSSNSGMPGSGSPGNCGTDITGTGFTTSFAYDLVNHKTTVTQGGQQRVFQTDWLGRTILTQEPERGQTTFGYTYNATGLLVTRQRPEANQTSQSVLTTTTTQYDSVGRRVSVNYSDGTLPLHYGYDVASVLFDPSPDNPSLKLTASLQNPVGRLAWTCRLNAAQNACNTQDAFSYDPSGRVTQRWSSTPSYVSSLSHVYMQAYGYDWLGNIQSASDGAGVITSYNNYSVANEVGSITSSNSDATHPGTLISNVTNGPNGPINYQLGNGLNALLAYDSMGRRDGGWICKGSTQNGCTGGTQIYGFTTSWKGVRNTAACDTSLNRCETFGYDEFNRLTSQTDISGTGQNFTWVYDRNGNRWQENPAGAQVSFNLANNQVATAGYNYDAAGNLVSDGVDSYSYDAEGNLTQEVTPSGPINFSYDALNEQVRTDYPSFGVSDELVFNPSGQLASLWQVGNGSPLVGKAYWGSTPVESYVPSKNMAYFQHRDWEYTERAITDATGSATGVRVSLPFGDDAVTTFGSRDNTYDGFTGLWDGAASSTNHAQFREYNNSEGRWNSPDPYDGSYDFSNPQSLNRYTYVLNNPLSYLDPTGYYFCDPDTSSTSTDPGGNVTETVTAGQCRFEPSDFAQVPRQQMIPTRALQPFRPSAPSKSVLGCAAKFASAHSIAGGLQSLGIGSHGGVGGFLTNTFGGNTFAGLYNLGSTLTSSSSTDQQVLTQMGKAYLRGPLQGIPASLVGASGPAAVSPVGMARGAALSSAFNAVTGADESLITLSGETALSTVGTTAAEFATGVGEAKFALDFLTFAVGVGTCIP